MVVRGAGMSLEDYGQHQGVTGLTLGCHQEVLDVTGGHWNGVEWELNGTELSLWRHWVSLGCAADAGKDRNVTGRALARSKRHQEMLAVQGFR